MGVCMRQDTFHKIGESSFILFTSPFIICTPCKHELDTGSLTDMLTAKMQFLFFFFFLPPFFFKFNTVQSSALDKLFTRELRADIHIKWFIVKQRFLDT